MVLSHSRYPCRDSPQADLLGWLRPESSHCSAVRGWLAAYQPDGSLAVIVRAHGLRFGARTFLDAGPPPRPIASSPLRVQ